MARIREPANRVGFLLQFGYFRAAGKFFSAKRFRRRDIKYVCRQLGLESVDMSAYVDRVPRRHRQRILSMLNWTPLEPDSFELLHETATRLVRDQEQPKDVFAALLDLCWRQRWVIPEYGVFADTISECFNSMDSSYVATIKRHLTDEQQLGLEQLLKTPPALARRPCPSPISNALTNPCARFALSSLLAI